MSPARAVGALVVNFNGGDKVVACIRALRAQTIRLADLVVVDNGSSDGSLERIREEDPAARIIQLGENYGLPFARNVGLKALATELALSVDADLYLAPDCAERLLGAMERHRAAIVCPRILLSEGSLVQCDGAGLHFLGTLALRHAYRPVTGLPARADFVGASCGGCLLIDRGLVLEAGGFDDRFFFYFEDLELSFRLRSRGYRIFWEPAAIALHDWGTGTPGLAFRGRARYPARRAYYTMRNRWLAILTHYRVRTLLVLAPVLVAYEGATLSLAVTRGWIREWARVLAWLIRNRKSIRARRRAAQRFRTVPDRELLEAGPIPLAPGLLRSPWSRALVAGFAVLMNGYWRISRPAIG